jgi:epoxyqueuosine reductase
MPGYGRVASYALAADYHHVLPPLLKTLGHKISRMAAKDVNMKVFVDSSPLLERDLASMAGMGWIGKNTCLISPETGSFLLLAEILMDIDLPQTESSVFDRCGSCRRCIDACPTGCIRPDRLIDAGRCISYLTIEHKGAIPTELRPLVGDWIFGCDVCQDVCPWNQKHARRSVSPIFNPVLATGCLNLADELRLTEDEFNRRYNGLPIKRSGFENHLRNAIICAGNSQMEKLVFALGDILVTSPSIMLRGHAAWALGRLPAPQSRPLLEASLKNEEHPKVQTEIKRSMENINNTEI